jgi:hypothetical protein
MLPRSVEERNKNVRKKEVYVGGDAFDRDLLDGSIVFSPRWVGDSGSRGRGVFL